MFNWAQEKVEKVPREEIIAAAKLCGYWSGQTIEMNDVGIERFYAIAFEAGRVAEREECANVCDEYTEFNNSPSNFAENCSKAIRARSTK